MAYKPVRQLLARHFIERKGGISKCAARCPELLWGEVVGTSLERALTGLRHTLQIGTAAFRDSALPAEREGKPIELQRSRRAR